MIPHPPAIDPASAHIEQGIQIKPVTVGESPLASSTVLASKANAQAVVAELEEEGVRIALTIVDTPGFGDNIDNEYWCV